MSREAILDRVRTALGRKPGQQAIAPPALLRSATSSSAERITQFTTAFEALAGKAWRVPDTASVRPTLESILAGRTAVAAPSALLEECGVHLLPNVRLGFTSVDEFRSACATADAGITTADYALAETGTLVILSSPEQSRLASLLPPAHIAIFRVDVLLAHLDELLTTLPNPTAQSSSMVLITGPSRTADIEQILVRGVHGPGEIDAILVG